MEALDKLKNIGYFSETNLLISLLRSSINKTQKKTEDTSGYQWLQISLYTLYICIQGVPGGMCQTSGECSLS